jgi:hypothetical protein
MTSLFNSSARQTAVNAVQVNFNLTASHPEKKERKHPNKKPFHENTQKSYRYRNWLGRFSNRQICIIQTSISKQRSFFKEKKNEQSDLAIIGRKQ